MGVENVMAVWEDLTKKIIFKQTLEAEGVSHVFEQSMLCVGNYNTRAWGEFPEQQKARVTGTVRASTRVLKSITQ